MIELSALPSLAAGPTAASADAASGLRTAGMARVAAGPTLGEKFEAAMLTPMIAAILPPDDSVVWGGGAGKMWRGLFAEEIAAATASAGSVGIAQIIDQAVAEQTGKAR